MPSQNDIIVAKLDLSVLDRIKAYPKKLNKAVGMIISDVYSRSPAVIGGAVAERYETGTLKAIKRRVKPGDRVKWSERGDTRLKVLGRLTGIMPGIGLQFVGSVFADWPTMANGRKKLPKLKKDKKTKRTIRQPYSVTRTILKGHTQTLDGRGGARVFVHPKGKSLRPYVAMPGKRTPFVMGGTSIPQAIAQPETVERWDQPLVATLMKRIEHDVQYAGSLLP